MKDIGIWEPHVVKTQSMKTAVESACMLLRIDDVVAGAKKQGGGKRQGGGGGGGGGGDDDGPQGADEDDRIG